MNKVRSILLENANRSLLVCFTKRDGTERHMLCQYRGSVSVRKQLMVVWDIAKHAKRTVNLDTTFRVVDPATGEILYEHAA